MFGCLAEGSPRRFAERTVGLSSPRGREISRTMRMAEARNKALAGFADECLDWLVVIDADLYAKSCHVWQLIEVLQRDPGVAMACASALQNLPDIFGRSPWSYYDSFALIDQGGRQGITGARVPLWDLADRAAWMAGRPVSVRSAFGGIAVLPMALPQRLQLRWQGGQGCEHWAFCLGQSGGSCIGLSSGHAPSHSRRGHDRVASHLSRPLSPTVEVVLAPRIDVKISASIAITLRALPLAPVFIVISALSTVTRAFVGWR